MALMWIGFNIVSDGTFLTARNLWNLSVQSASIAIMATGMVLVIVSRNIDLSVGAMLGFVGYTMAMAQTVWLPADPRARPRAPGHLDRHRTPGARARPGHRRHPGLRHRLRGHPVLHRHPRRPARLARPDLPVRAGADDRADGPHVPAAGRRSSGLAGTVGIVGRRHHRGGHRSRRPHPRPASPGEVRVPGAAGVGHCRHWRGVDRGHHRCRRGRQRLSVAAGARRAVRGGERHRGPARGPHHPGRASPIRCSS